MQRSNTNARIAIACGGTGGHLFPGLAVAEQLRKRGCAITLLISPKEVDQEAVRSTVGMQVVTLPAVGLGSRGAFAFARGFAQSFLKARRLFSADPPDAVLAMGGFTSAPPVLASRLFRAPAFLHESNTIPGRANRWLSWTVSQAFVGFAQAADRLRTKNVKTTGTPVRSQFQPGDIAGRRTTLGLDPDRPVLLVTGGSQGASGLNDLVVQTLPLLAKAVPELQVFHLTGPNDVQKVEAACAEHRIKAVVRPFFADMHVALGAASAVISRAGASSLAELAAMQLPAILVPYPAATDNHQYYNALAFEKSGAARLLEQRNAKPELLAPAIVELIEDTALRRQMQESLAQWHAPNAASQIADDIMQTVRDRRSATGRSDFSSPPNVEHRQSITT
jgi:UDP-N-acetylglucosamine--N-acetylmuramyl-(pentapeptide) pyrophosphoryl-undecaprenol N-acetylglucosamine transferase